MTPPKYFFLKYDPPNGFQNKTMTPPHSKCMQITLGGYMPNDFAQHRQRTGKSMLKSSSTVYNRMKPINVHHTEAKKHIGRSLFCIRNPSKIEANEKMHTKYQRTHVKQCLQHLSAKDKTQNGPCNQQKTLDRKQQSIHF